MGFAEPFSSVGKILVASNIKKTGCLLDTNFLIALTYEVHAFHEEARALFNQLFKSKVPLYVGLPARSEFLDFQRRLAITEAVMDMLAFGSRWRISKEATKLLRAHKLWIDGEAKINRLPVLTDARIKQCKELFLPRSQSGKIGWLEICASFLRNIQTTWQKTEETLGIQYVGVREAEDGALFSKKLKWENLYVISAKTCMSSQDAMLLNLFDSSVFDILITTDFDLAYGNLAEANSKCVLVPDGLYLRKIKALRFPESTH